LGEFFIDKILGFFWRNVFFGANLTKFPFSMGKIQQFFDIKIIKKIHPYHEHKQ
jgi:hypothetical protein